MSNLFLRHGEVENVKNIMYGDIPGYRLSSKGVLQAKEAGNFIKDNFQIDKIISVSYTHLTLPTILRV